MPVKISASLMCADLCNLERDVRALEEAGVDWLHFDIMDGQFVPNITLGADVVRAVRQITDLPLDVHLMVEQPERYIAEFVDAGSDIVAIHVEATRHVRTALRAIRDAGAQAGLCLNPATHLDRVEYAADLLDMLVVMTVDPGFAGQKLIPAILAKIADVRELLQTRGLEAEIQVDGNVSFEHAPKMVTQGATCLVAGTSSVFHKDLTIAEGIRRLRAAVQ